MRIQNLNSYDSNYSSSSKIKWYLWYLVDILIFSNRLITNYTVKTILLRLFGAEVGIGVVIKPGVKIKYPWLLRIGDNSWIGEDVWIDNQAMVTIGSNVCISQGAYIFTGNHNFKRVKFDLMISSIVIQNQAWIGAKTIICPGSIVGYGAVVSVGVRITGKVEDLTIVKLIQSHEYKERQVDRF